MYRHVQKCWFLSTGKKKQKTKGAGELAEYGLVLCSALMQEYSWFKSTTRMKEWHIVLLRCQHFATFI